MNLIKILTAESQSNEKIYALVVKFYYILSENNWVKDYIFWELELLKILGYDLQLKTLVNKKIINNKILYFAESSTEKKIVPNFLIDKDYPVNDMSTLLTGLNLVGDFLEKNILKPNNLNSPASRLQFINSLKYLRNNLI